MKRLLLNACVAFIGLSVYAQQSTTQVVAPNSNVDLQDPSSITLKPGFWAKPGSVFRAHIGYEALNMQCRIVTHPSFAISHVNPNSYSPDAIGSSRKLQLTHDSAGNVNRIYFANAQSGTSNIVYDAATISSLIYVYPNPTRGKITVSWDDSIDHLIHAAALITPSGVSIPITIASRGGSRQAALTFSGSKGAYFLRIQLTDGRIISKTVLKH